MSQVTDDTFRVAVLQMVSTRALAGNLDKAAMLLREAAAQGARIAVLPENFACFPVGGARQIAVREQDGDGPVRSFLRRQARELGLWIVGGSVPVQERPAGPVYSASFVLDPDGHERARYDKMHLFDVDVAGDSQPRYRESDDFQHGGQPLVIDLPFCRLGVIICYDLRFPELVRSMALQGMDLLAVPSAFTATTGRAHWELLLRARAVENLCWVAAADQGGTHPGGRETWGHSMIVGPWGEIVAQCTTGAQVLLADVSPGQAARYRAAFPVLQHARLKITS